MRPDRSETSQTPRARRLRLALVAWLALFVAVLTPAASADRTFTQRFSQIVRGDVAYVSNTIMSCPTSANNCASARNGNGYNNSDFTEAYVDIDGDATTFDSSSGTLALPAGSTVLFAGLYWGADTLAGTGGANAPTPASSNLVKLRTPAAAYQTVTASVVDTDSKRTSRYQGFADVTSLVQAGGNGTYTVGNVQAATGADRYGGWTMMVAYRDAAQNVRWLGVYDGFRSFANTDAAGDITLTGFQTPSSGTVNAFFGMTSYEGDQGLVTETAQLNGVNLIDGAHPTSNYFDSVISRGGVNVTAKSPNYANQLGYDSNVMTVNGFIPNNTTSATVHLGTSQDLFLPGAMSLAIDQFATPPANTSPPTITGTPQDGQTLTANTGTWTGSPTPTFTYQWRRCDSAGANCVDIAGATNSTYVASSVDVTKTIRVVVTGTNAHSAVSATSAQVGTVSPQPPANTVAPTISGTARDGQTLTAANGTWTGTPTITFGYQWRRCDSAGNNCSDIAGATASTYLETPADIGSTIRVVVTGTNAGGSANATSAQTAVVAAIPPANTVAPTISGTARDGQTLTVANGTWTGSPTIAFTYQWRRCNTSGASCVDIAGATATTYVQAPADVGSTIRVVVTGTNAGGSANGTSAQTGTVAAAPPVNTTPPTITGTAQDGSTLTGSNGIWSGTPTITYTYQWRRCDAAGANCSNIASATNATYALVPADVGSTLRLNVTGTNTAGNSTATSAQTGVVSALPPSNTAPPTISGTARDGQTLTAAPGTWSGTPTLTFTYQWRRCDSAGNNCSNIAGATGSTYLQTPADIGSTIRVMVIGSNGGGSGTATSAQTGVVAAIPPANTVAPTISGTARDGQTLTVANGTWTGSPTIAFTYQWRRCNTSGASCVDIAGATATTYVQTPTDVGSTMRVVVTGTNAGGSANGTSTQTGTVAAAPPVNTTPPTITGTPQDGQTLTGSNGIWTGTPTISYTYQWRRCDSAGNNCSNIAGATNATYTATQSDVDSTLRLVVTASNAAGSAVATASQTGVVTPLPPVNNSLPSISGQLRDGQTATAANGTWTGTPTITYAYQWRRCNAGGASCADIAGATSSTYLQTAADVDSTLRVVVTATNAGGSTPATSPATAKVAPTAPVNTVAPSISGQLEDAQTLTAHEGTWTGTPAISYGYQWRRCDAAGSNCSDIAGATNATYFLVSADVDNTIRVVVTGTNVAGNSAATSPETGAVAPTEPVSTSLPGITGTTQDGQTLAGSNGTWSGTPTLSFTRQWRRCDAAGSNCSDIAGATNATYDLVPTDVGSTLRIVVTATNAADDTSATSPQSSVVTPLPAHNTSAPSISGTLRDGQTLTAANGTWTGTPTITYAYQWRRCNAGGASCADIAGATGSTYFLTSADVGGTVRVVVTGTNAGGSDSATSPASGSVASQAPGATAPPTISGTAQDSRTLTAANGTWSGTPTITFGRQWRRCDSGGNNCSNIAGATGQTYVLTPADVGSTIRVVVTGTNAGGSTPATSAPTVVVTALPPVNTAVPTITGVTHDGHTLTVDRGTWTGTPTLGYLYQWRRCDAAGANCADVTGQTGTSYDLVAGDVGFTFRVVVTGVNAGGTTGAVTAPTAVITPEPPASSSAPSVSGTPRDGQVLTADKGTWTGTPTITYAYQWQRCSPTCADIAGAGGTTYTLVPADIGTQIRVRVTATNGGGGTTAPSALTAVVTAIPPANVTLPTIGGTFQDTKTLTAADGTWSGSPTIAYTYQWRRCDALGASCADIAGATAQTYALTPADVGAALRVRVTGTNGGGNANASSQPTPAIIALPPANRIAPSVSGTARDGRKLTVDKGAWDGTPGLDYGYQWQRCAAAGTDCVDIPGATGTMYELTPADVGKSVRVVVTAENTVGEASAQTSASDEVAPVKPETDGRPSITGVPTEGTTLTAHTGDWTGPGPITHAYQWQRCDAAGAHCVPVTGATAKTYVLGAADVGHTMRVLVTATNPDGTEDATSEDTAPVTGKGPVVDPNDISTSIPDSQVTTARCQRVLAGTGFKQQKVKGVGKIRVQVLAAAYISPKNPLKVTATVPAGKVRALAYILDKREIARPKKAPYALSVSPKLFAQTGAHKLALKVTPTKGRSHRMTLNITTAACTNVLSASQWRTNTGTGLRLRVDSKTALKTTSFTVPKAMLPTKADLAKGPIGTAKLYLAGGKTATAPFTLTPTGVKLGTLPAGVGVVELTLFTRNTTSPNALLAKGKKAKLSALVTPAKGRAVKLTTVIRAQRH